MQRIVSVARNDPAPTVKSVEAEKPEVEGVLYKVGRLTAVLCSRPPQGCPSSSERAQHPQGVGKDQALLLLFLLSVPPPVPRKLALTFHQMSPLQGGFPATSSKSVPWTSVLHPPPVL